MGVRFEEYRRCSAPCRIEMNGLTSSESVQSVDQVPLVVSPCCYVGFGFEHFTNALLGEGLIVSKLWYTVQSPPLRLGIV